MPPGPQPYPDAVCPVGSAPGVCATKATNLAWVSGGNYMSCWVTTDGGLACSGLAMNGSMGPGGIDRKNPTAIALPAGIVAASVTTSGSSSCVLSTTGVPVCFGANGSGQLGRTAANAQPNLSTICDDAACTARLEGVAQLELGGDFGCARLTGSGAVRCWGGNGRGQLGDGSTADKAYAEPPILMDARWISAGSGHACAVTGPEEIRCWGDDTFGQLGDGDATHTAKPTPVLVRF
jgi:alpha-tubulin suppressor-like RCC1 family protein